MLVRRPAKTESPHTPHEHGSPSRTRGRSGIRDKLPTLAQESLIGGFVIDMHAAKSLSGQPVTMQSGDLSRPEQLKSRLNRGS